MERTSDEECETKVIGLPIILNDEVISIVTRIQKGKKWDLIENQLSETN